MHMKVHTVLTSEFSKKTTIFKKEMTACLSLPANLTKGCADLTDFIVK